MSFSLRNFLEEAVTQVNPFDKGQTAQTVRNNRQAVAAQTIKKQQDEQNIQRIANQRNAEAFRSGQISRDQYQQQSNKIFNNEQPQLHDFRSTGFVRNIFDANTGMDKLRRVEQGQPTMYRDQQIAMGNKRPYENLAGQFIGNTSRLLNTTAAAISSVPYTARIQAARATNNMPALENALRDAEGLNQVIAQPDSGLFKTGTFLYDSPEEAANLTLQQGLKRSALNTLGTASEVAPFKVNPMQAAKFTTRLVANAGVDALAGGAESAARQYANTGNVNLKTLAIDAGSNAVLGAVPTVTTSLVSPAAKQAVQNATNKTTQVVKDVGNKIQAGLDPVAQALNDHYNQLNRQWQTASPQARKQIEKAIKENREEFKRITRDKDGFVQIGRNAPDELVKKVFRQQSDDNALYHGTTYNNALGILEDGKIKANKPNADRKLRFEEGKSQVSMSRQRNSGFYNTESSDVKFVVDKNKIGKTRAYADGELKPSSTDYRAYEAESQYKKDVGIDAIKRIEGGPLLEKADEYRLRKLAEKNNIPFIAYDDTNAMRKVLPIREDAQQAGTTGTSQALALEPSASVPRNSGQTTTQQALRVQKTPQASQDLSVTDKRSLVNNTPKTREVKLNTDRLNPDSGYAGLAEMQKRTTEVVDTLSNKEIQSLAKDAGIDTVTHSPEQIKKKIAEQLNVRQDAVRYMNEAEVARKAGNMDLAEQSMMKAAEAGRISRSQGSELGQQLQARRIIANQLDTPQQRIFKLLDNAGINPESYVKRLANVDFNDPKQVVEAYRDLVPAKEKDWLDVVRYNSMLSSPLTHAVNAMSNSVNVGVVAPLEKTVRGVADAVGGLFGKERKFAAGEGVAYMTGAAKNLKKAAKEFADVMSGRNQMQNLDLNEYSTPLATKGKAGAAYKTLSAPMKLLGASDKFFRTLAESGEENALNLRQSKGIKVKGDIKALAEAEGSYRLYQQDTDLKGQGQVLSVIDGVTNSIMKLRKDHAVFKWVFPFVKTPTNILKQGVEFSPVGFLNLRGNSDKATALTRASIGTAVFGTAAAMIAAGDMTWGEPTNADERDRFRAEGKQPYAVRIGGKWIAFNKLPPAFSYPMALTAGIHDAVENGKISEETGSRIFEGVAKWGQFLSDQSYVKNIGDTLNAFKGDPEKTVQAIANYPQQVIPFRALTGWIARMTDDTERRIKSDKKGLMSEVDKQVQSLMQQYPFLRQKTGTRDYEGTPIPSNNPVLNSFSPLRVTDDRGTSELDMIRDQYKAQEKAQRAMKDSFKTESESGKADVSNQDYKVDSDGKVYAKLGDEYKTFDNMSLYEKAKAKQEKQKVIDDFMASNDKTKEIDGKIYYKNDNTESGYSVKNKAEWDYDKSVNGLDLAIDKAKASNDLKGWEDAADKKYQALIKKRDSYDPETEFDKIDTVNKQLLNLEQEASKYSSNGYIKKPKTSKYKFFGFGSDPISTTKSLRQLLKEATLS